MDIESVVVARKMNSRVVGCGNELFFTIKTKECEFFRQQTENHLFKKIIRLDSYLQMQTGHTLPRVLFHLELVSPPRLLFFLPNEIVWVTEDKQWRFDQLYITIIFITRYESRNLLYATRILLCPLIFHFPETLLLY